MNHWIIHLTDLFKNTDSFRNETLRSIGKLWWTIFTWSTVYNTSSISGKNVSNLILTWLHLSVEWKHYQSQMYWYLLLVNCLIQFTSNNYRLLFSNCKKKFKKFEKTHWLNVYWYECCDLQMILFLLFRIQQSSLTVIVNGILPS